MLIFKINAYLKPLQFTINLNGNNKLVQCMYRALKHCLTKNLHKMSGCSNMVTHVGMMAAIMANRDNPYHKIQDNVAI